VLQSVAACCSVMQCTSTWTLKNYVAFICNDKFALQVIHVAACCSMLQRDTACCSVPATRVAVYLHVDLKNDVAFVGNDQFALQVVRVAVCCSVLQRDAVCCSVPASPPLE